MAEGRHPVPFRTRKLSPPAPMVLPWRRGGRVGRRRDFISKEAAFGRLLCVVSAPGQFQQCPRRVQEPAGANAKGFKVEAMAHRRPARRNARVQPDVGGKQARAPGSDSKHRGKEATRRSAERSGRSQGRSRSSGKGQRRARNELEPERAKDVSRARRAQVRPAREPVHLADAIVRELHATARPGKGEILEWVAE